MNRFVRIALALMLLLSQALVLSNVGMTAQTAHAQEEKQEKPEKPEKPERGPERAPEDMVVADVLLRVSSHVITANGNSKTMLSAFLLDEQGHIIKVKGEEIEFTTSLGTLKKVQKTNGSGKALALLTSAEEPGMAKITASYEDVESNIVAVLFEGRDGEGDGDCGDDDGDDCDDDDCDDDSDDCDDDDTPPPPLDGDIVVSANPDVIEANGVSTTIITARVANWDDVCDADDEGDDDRDDDRDDDGDDDRDDRDDRDPGNVYMCESSFIDVVAAGMNGKSTQTLTIPNSDWSLVQLGGTTFGSEPPSSVTFAFDGQTETLDDPTRPKDGDIKGYTFETPGKPGDMTATIEGDENAQSLVAYYASPTNTVYSGAFEPTLQYTWGGDNGNGMVGPAKVMLKLPEPLPEDMDVQVNVVVMDKDPQSDKDQRIVIVRAEAGGATVEETLENPDEAMVNVVEMTLSDVPAGTREVHVMVESPETPKGESQWNNPEAGDSVFLMGASAWHACEQSEEPTQPISTTNALALVVTEPITPTDPTDPMEPTEPITPTDPTDPMEPTEPITPTESISDTLEGLDALVDGYYEGGQIRGKGVYISLKVKLQHAMKHRDNDRSHVCVNVLGAFVNEVEAKTGHEINGMDEAIADELIAMAQQDTICGDEPGDKPGDDEGDDEGDEGDDDPMEPTEPITPTDPMEPTEPTDPTDPMEPTDPACTVTFETSAGVLEATSAAIDENGVAKVILTSDVVTGTAVVTATFGTLDPATTEVTFGAEEDVEVEVEPIDDSEGEEVSCNKGAVEVEFPRNTFGEDVDFIFMRRFYPIQPVMFFSRVSFWNPLNYYMSLHARGHQGKHHKKFEKTVTIRINLIEVMSYAYVYDISTIQLVYWNGTDWVDPTDDEYCHLDGCNQTVTEDGYLVVDVDHFSEFALVNNIEENTVFLPTVFQ